MTKYYAYIYLSVLYKCQHCQTVNEYVQTVHECVEGTDRQPEEWQKIANDDLQKRLIKIFEEKEIGEYRAAEFDCRCQKCRRRPLWSLMRYAKLQKLAIWWLVMFAFMILPACYYSWIYGLICLAIAAALLFVCFGIPKLHGNYVTKLVHKLPREYHPTFFLMEKKNNDDF